ncbi:hypothetical protein F4604DRAFT_331362 [Suillus subluteus]|nr:hypothetical protein F4604DRAFT_331362 [Suillus subluteus]
MFSLSRRKRHGRYRLRRLTVQCAWLLRDVRPDIYALKYSGVFSLHGESAVSNFQQRQPASGQHILKLPSASNFLLTMTGLGRFNKLHDAAHHHPAHMPIPLANAVFPQCVHSLLLKRSSPSCISHINGRRSNASIVPKFRCMHVGRFVLRQIYYISIRVPSMTLHPTPAPVMAGFPANFLRLTAIINGRIIIAFGYGFPDASSTLLHSFKSAIYGSITPTS